MYSSISSKENLFPSPENPAHVEVSKAFAKTMLRADQLKTKAFVTLLLADLPRSVHNKFAKRFNKAIKVFNANRRKVSEIARRGYNPDFKIFTIEKEFGVVASIFQSIESFAKKYPKKKYEEPEIHNNKSPKNKKDLSAKIGRRLYAAGAITLTTPIILAACDAIDVPQAEIQDPASIGQEQSNGDTAQDLVNNTEDGQEIGLQESGQEISPEATDTPTAEEMEELNNEISKKINEALDANPATKDQYQEAEIQAMAAVFANELAEKKIVNAEFIKVIASEGRVRVETTANDDNYGEAGDVSIAYTGEKDGMFLTLKGGLEVLGIGAANEADYDISFNDADWYAVIRDKNDNIVGVVGQEKEWTKPENATALESAASNLLETYLEEGTIDVSNLSASEFAKFSQELAGKRNEDRGVSVVVFDSGDGNPAYIDNNLDMRPYDGEPDQSEVIEMFLPVAGFDSEGNLQIEQDGKVITIANSNDVDWGDVITDSNDPRFDWSTAKIGLHMSSEQRNPIILKPAFLLDKDFHSFYIEGNGMREGLKFFTVEETDENGIPILFRMSFTIPSGFFALMEEGSDNFYYRMDGSKTKEFDANLQENSTYYFGINTDVEHVYANYLNGSIDSYSGIVQANDIIPTLKNNVENKQDFIIVPTQDITIHK